MNLTAVRLLRLKHIIFNAWGLNLFQPHPMAPIPNLVLRRMGAM